MLDRLIKAFRRLDEHLGDNAYLHGARLVRDPRPLLRGHRERGTPIVTSRNTPKTGGL